MRIELMDLDVLQKAPRNAKRHALDDLGASFDRFGFVEPLGIDETTGRLVFGHGRLDDLLAKRALGESPPKRIVRRNGKWLVPVIRGVSFKDGEEAEAYLLAANQLVIKGGFDAALHAQMVADASRTAAGLLGTGYGAVDVEALAQQARDAAEAARTAAAAAVAGDAPTSEVDDGPPVIPTDALVKKWGTAPGQLWVVPSLKLPGREHRLVCGDCRDPASVKRLHGTHRPKLGLHDPPYGISIVAGSPGGGNIGDGIQWGKALAPRGHFSPIVGDSARGKVGGSKPFGDGHGKPIKATTYAHGDDEPFDPAHLLAFFGRLVLWGANNYADRLPPSAGAIVWDKRVDMPSNDFSDGELAWVSPNLSGSLRFIRHLWNGLIRASERGERRLHPTQKPIAVQAQIVEWHTDPGDIVADWYMGAGGVILACEQLGRIGHGMDIAPAYVAATLERMSLRGCKPRLVESAAA